MSAQNENIIIAVEIIGAVADIPVITQAELLATDYTGDEGAEFLCELFNTINYFENYIDNPEALCLPDESQDGDQPYLTFIDKLNELMNYTWAKRTLTRMTRLAEGIQATQRLTQLQKSEHPDYVQCPNCLDYFLKKRNGLEKHMANPICAERNTRMFVKGNNDKKLPSGKYLHTVMVMNELIGRSIAYKKNIEPELEEEEIKVNCESCDKLITEDDKNLQQQLEDAGFCGADVNCVCCWDKFMKEMIAEGNTAEDWEEGLYIVRGYIEDEEPELATEKINDYAYVVKVYLGYLGDEYQPNYIYNEKGSWSNQDEAKIAFNKAIECQEYNHIELVCKRGDDDAHEQLIDEWETDDTCYECGRPLPDGEYLNGEDLVCYNCWYGETTKTDSEDEDEDECKFCSWRSEYPESHIQFGNVKCGYITDKYDIVFNEDGEIQSVLKV